MLGKTAIKPIVHTEEYLDPPKMEWFTVYRNNRPAGEMLGCFELIKSDIGVYPEIKEIEKNSMIGKVKTFTIPYEIRPTLKKFRLEIIFWGIRQTKRIRLLSVKSPIIIIECGGFVIESTLESMEKNANFSNPLKFIDIELPEDERFWPPITITCVEKRRLGGMVFVGNASIRNLTRFKWSNFLAVYEKRKKKWKQSPEITTEGENLNETGCIIDQASAIESSRISNERRPSKISFTMINEQDTTSLKKRNSVSSLSKKEGRRSLHSSKLQLPSIGEEGGQQHKDVATSNNISTTEELNKTVESNTKSQLTNGKEENTVQSTPPAQATQILIGQGQPHVTINLLPCILKS